MQHVDVVFSFLLLFLPFHPAGRKDIVKFITRDVRAFSPHRRKTKRELGNGSVGVLFQKCVTDSTEVSRWPRVGGQNRKSAYYGADINHEH